MKKALLPFGLALAASFLAGYAFRGGGNLSPSPGEGRTAQAEHAKTSGGEEPRTSSRSSRTTQATSHAFAAPFAAGRAEEWLHGLTSAQQGDYASATLEFSLTCGRLDAAAAEELARACLKAKGLSDESDHIGGKSTLTDEWLAAAMMRLAEVNPSLAMELLHHPEDSSMPDEALAAVFTIVSREDPQQARTAMDALADDDRGAAAAAFAREYSKNDPEAALSMLQGMAAFDNARSECLIALAATDPDRALSIALKDQSQAELAWLASDLTTRGKLADWLASDGNPGGIEMRSQAFQALLSQDFDAATPLWARLAAGMDAELQTSTAAEIASRLSSNASAAQEWLDGIGDNALRQRAILALSEASLGDINPWIGSGQTRTNNDFIGPIDGVPIAIASSSANIVTGGLRSGSGAISRNNIDAVLNNPSQGAVIYASPVSDSLSGWIGELPPSPEKDELTVRLIGRLQSNNPNLAQQWIDTLPDSPQKNYLTRQTQLRGELQALEEAKWEDASR